MTFARCFKTAFLPYKGTVNNRRSRLLRGLLVQQMFSEKLQLVRRARNWNSAGMRIRPPRSPEPSASGASKWAGVDDGRLPSLSQMQMFMAATILEGGCREASGGIHI